MIPENGFRTSASSAVPCERALDGIAFREMLSHRSWCRVSTYATSAIIWPGSSRWTLRFHMRACGVLRSRNAVVTVPPTAVAGGSKYPELNGLRSDAPGGGVFGAAGGVPDPTRFTVVDVRNPPPPRSLGADPIPPLPG